MDINNIPFDLFDVDEERGQEIIKGILDKLNESPNDSIEIQHIANRTGSTGYDVKKVFYYLLYHHFLTATFIPYHKICESPLGQAVESVDDIDFDYLVGSVCTHCPDPIEDIDEIEVRFVFGGA